MSDAAAMKIALRQSAGAPCDVPANLALVRSASKEAAAAGARLIVFPECFLTGYSIGERVRDLAEPADGPSLATLAEIAAAAKIAIVCGYPERAGDTLFNSAAVIGRDGSRLANYRKVHLYGDYENAYFRPGEGLVTTQVDGIKLGVLICYDIEFPEPARALARAGVDLLVVPTSLMTPADGVALHMVPTRARENQIFVAYANRLGREADLDYVGRSCIAGPDGADLARAGVEEELLVAEIDLSAIARARAHYDYLADSQIGLDVN
jgi:predicted amidohydrolase